MSARLETTQCPGCGLPGTLRIENVMHANPIGSWSLAGVMLKLAARDRPNLMCTQCPYRLVGDYYGRHAVFQPQPKAVA